MSEVTVKDIQSLRQTAGVGMMDAKKALTDADGDFDKAFELLRERGQAQMAKRADREANEGTIGTYLHEQNGRPVLGVLVELACETDFVAKSDEFRQVADDVAMHISWANPGWLRREDVDAETVEKERELISRQAVAEGKTEQVIDKIVDGKIESWYTDNVLYDQKFVNSDKFDGSVGEMISQLATRMGENISVRRMSRIAVGE
ncbi:MAG TPA: elongation factor Ts [Acidimicrobiia bacterium]|nr:elongation factor Ts [Acidimicrobiia bacterium]